MTTADRRPRRGRTTVAAALTAAASLLAGALGVAGAVGVTASVAVPGAAAQTSTSGSTDSSSTTTAPVVTLPGPTTTTSTTSTTSTTVAPATSPTTARKTTSTTRGAGVPPVPVGGPPTTVAPAGTKSSAPAAPQPSVDPILSQVDSDLAQLGAINEFKPAQALVATAQSQVTLAGAALLSARQSQQQAQFFNAVAQGVKTHADTQLRDLALAAYMGVGYSGLGGPQGPNGNQGQGTVSTPFGLSGMNAIDAEELLMLVGQHAKTNDDDATHLYARTQKALAGADKALSTAQAQVTAAENGLLNAQQTLDAVVTAATTPGAAAAGALPPLQLDDATQPPPTTTTTTPATTPGGGLAAAEVQSAAPDINGAPPVSPPILSAPALDAAQLQAWWATLKRQPNLTVPIDNLIQSYANWGKILGVRFDVAFAQSIVETAYFSFPSYGQLTAADNNFAGIGACDSCATGWSFPSADIGVEAQLELLYEYATDQPLPANVKNVIGATGVGGCCQTWIQLAGKWATATTYGISIMTVYQSMLQWLIPQQELADGLIAPTTASAQGPELAPLPGSKPAPTPKSPTSPTSPPAAGTPAGTPPARPGTTTVTP